jgi:hypothetical protein
VLPYIDSNGNIATFTRNSYFNLNNPGFKLYMERGSGIFLRINNTLFMHGQVYDNTYPSFTFNKCDTFNKWINKSAPLNKSDQIFTDFIAIDNKGAPQLWARNYGDDEFTDRRFYDRSQDPNGPDQFCNNVIVDITAFLVDHPNNTDLVKKINPDDIRIVIGHCPQNYSTSQFREPARALVSQLNRTFTTQRQIDDISVELIKPAETFEASRQNVDDNKVFGISMECPNTSEPHHKVYKVDVGTSRGFDQIGVYNAVSQSGHSYMKKYFLSRVPQVLEFLGDTVRIIRSTLKNTRIHQERKKFEELINEHVNVSKNLPQDMSRTHMTYGGYKEKYLKYKNKYLNLKNLIG